MPTAQPKKKSITTCTNFAYKGAVKQAQIISALQVQKTLSTQSYGSVIKNGILHQYPSTTDEHFSASKRKVSNVRNVADNWQPLKPSLKKKPGGLIAIKSPFVRTKESNLTTEAAENQESMESEIKRRRPMPRESNVGER